MACLLLRRTLVVLTTMAISACSGGSSAPATPAPALVPTASLQATAGGTSATAAVQTPLIGGVHGTLSLATTSSRAVATVATATVTSERAVQSVSNATNLYSFTFESPDTISLSSIPLLTLTLANAPPPNDNLYVQITNAGGTVIATEGPATVTALTAAFPLVSTPFTLEANAMYTLSVYETLPDQSLLYVANASDNSIVVFSRLASGDVAPLRRIAGASTGLSNPTSIAVDPATGALWALNTGASPATLTAYTATADGNATPVHTYTLPTLSVASAGNSFIPHTSAVTISPDGTNVVVAGRETTTNLDDIWTYDTRSGALIRFVYSSAGNNLEAGGFLPYQGYGDVQGVAFTSDDNIVDGMFYLDRSSVFDLTPVMARTAASTGPTDFVTPLAEEPSPQGFCPGPFGYDAGSYAWGSTTPCTTNEPAIYDYVGTGGTSSLHTLTGSNTQIAATMTGLAVASNGSIFEADSTGAVNAFPASDNGNVAPQRRISGPLTQLTSPIAIAVYGSETTF